MLCEIEDIRRYIFRVFERIRKWCLTKVSTYNYIRRVCLQRQASYRKHGSLPATLPLPPPPPSCSARASRLPALTFDSDRLPRPERRTRQMFRWQTRPLIHHQGDEATVIARAAVVAIATGRAVGVAVVREDLQRGRGILSAVRPTVQPTVSAGLGAWQPVWGEAWQVSSSLIPMIVYRILPIRCRSGY